MESSLQVLENAEKSLLDQSKNMKNPNKSPRSWIKQPIDRVNPNCPEFNVYSLRSSPITAHNLIASIKYILPGYKQVPFNVEVSQNDLYFMLQAYFKPFVDGGKPRRHTTRSGTMKNFLVFLQGVELYKLKAYVLSSFFTFCYFLRKYRDRSAEMKDAYSRIKNGIAPSNTQILAVAELIVNPGEMVNAERIRGVFRYKKSIEMKELFNSNQALLDEVTEEDEPCMKYYFRCFEIETPIEQPGDEFVMFRNKAGDPLYVRGRELLTLAQINARESVETRSNEEVLETEYFEYKLEVNDYWNDEDNFEESDAGNDVDYFEENDNGNDEDFFEKSDNEDDEGYLDNGDNGDEDFVEEADNRYHENNIEEIENDEYHVEEDYDRNTKEEHMEIDEEEYIDHDEELIIEDNEIDVEEEKFQIIQEKNMQSLTLTLNQGALQTTSQNGLDPSITKIYQSFEKYFDNERHSDVKFVFFDGKCIHAHAVILENKSDVFADMFSLDVSVTSPGIVNITDVDYEVMYEAIRFIYTDKVHNMDQFAVELLEPAKRFMLEDLKVLCEHQLCEKLSIVNVIDYLILAEDYNLCRLKEEAKKIVVTNMKDIVHLTKFEKLMTHYPKIALEIVRCNAVN